MPTTTTNYGFFLPLVNNATDQDLWGGYLNTDISNFDALLSTAMNFKTVAETATFTAVAPTAGSSTVGNSRSLFLCNATTGAMLANLPTAASAGNGCMMAFKKTDSSTNTVTITPNGTDKIDTASNFTLANQNNWAILVSDGISNWNILSDTLQPTSIVNIGQVQGVFKNLKINWTSTTAAAITVDALSVSNGAGAYLTLQTVSLTLATGSSGANGIDAGSVAANRWYYLYVIYNPTTVTTACLMSLSATAPTLPSGYTYFARVGTCLTDGAAALTGFIQYGRETRWKVGSNLPNLPLMASGASGNPNSGPTYTAIAVAGFVPPTAGAIDVMGNMTDPGGIMTAAPNNSYGFANGTNPPPLAICLTGFTRFSVSERFALETTNIYYAASTGSGGFLQLFAQGYVDNL